MSKEKYTLSENMISVTKEPVQNSIIKHKKKTTQQKSRISLNIDQELKTDLHMHCVKEKVAMTDVIEMLIKNYVRKNK